MERGDTDLVGAGGASRRGPRDRGAHLASSVYMRCLITFLSGA